MAVATSIFHPLAMNEFGHWLRLLRAGGGIERRYWPRAALITLASPLWGPLRLAERLAYGRALARTRIGQPPVFLLGHWRTGTTHLHNIFSQDPQFGYVTTFQTLAPSSFLLGRYTLRPLVAMRMPATRPMDNMPLSPDLPQEEEFALCNVTPHSFYTGWYFPRRLPELFERCVLFDGIEPGAMREWETHYLELLKKATLACGGKRLVLKNPSHTGRIPALLKLFPDAKFIHLHRDPYTVFQSTVRLHETTFATIGFQDLPRETIVENVLSFYERLMRRYLATRELIPKENLVEVRYESLDARPIETLESIYTSLGIAGWDTARPFIEQYLSAQDDYEKNRFNMPEQDARRVDSRLGFAFDAWEYPRRGETRKAAMAGSH